MPWLETIEERLPVIPARGRRLALLVAIGLMGVLVAYGFAPVAGWSNAAPTMLVLALIAGISALWSP